MEDLDVGGRIILKYAVKVIELGGRGLNSSFGIGRRAVGGLSMTINLRFP